MMKYKFTQYYRIPQPTYVSLTYVRIN